MTRDGDASITDEAMAAFEAKLDEQSEELREALAEDLGGEPDDYRRQLVADGGE